MRIDSALALAHYHFDSLTRARRAMRNPRLPSAVHTLTQPSSIAVTLFTREDGTPALSHALPKSFPSTSSPDPSLGSDVSSLIDKLHAILKTLPLEDPRSSEEIYSMDTSIIWESRDLEWCNGSPAECTGEKSMVQANAEEKARFKHAVDIIQELFEQAEKEG
ncbi:hypothetical protein MSAN_01097400 [Mycena sanguinolenta]|uniref:Uncharacterized protein n=1 Tax=Mycena sanguinolenta TaxID=230812 RepID=A0A8H6YTJ0_9AGAR|nr:hypothetical protein MSAN_01097400 [Mycena sanguinolenta]